MDWVKIEPGCDYPEPRQLVAVKISINGVSHGKFFARFIANELFGGVVDLPKYHKGPVMITHWVPVEMPNN